MSYYLLDFITICVDFAQVKHIDLAYDLCSGLNKYTFRVNICQKTRKMLKPDLQHQFWVTKKAVQRKLGTKEDECIVSSDAELDSKIDLLKSIADSCTQLRRIINNYQEKICILAQEENATGVFLKEWAKHNEASGKAMCCAGKSISYCGQQHMKVRAPLVRLHHEVDTFIGRAIKDTYITVQAMERERTEYRAALGWMKAASAQLDPDKGRGLDKFRNAQTYVRTAKTKFDTMTLDCLQKVIIFIAPSIAG